MYLYRICLAILPAALLTACGGGGTGTLSVGLTDAPTEAYKAVYVTIDAVQVHAKGPGEDNENAWVTIASPKQTFNLLDLTNGVVAGLGQGPLEAGSYTQIRLIIGATPDAGPNLLCHSHPFANYVIDADDEEIHELTVPSGEQTGLKLICAGKCDIAENQTTELILDFDAAASVVVAGNSGNYNLKPTIKILETEDFTLVTGRVTKSLDGSGIAAAVVTAQIFDALVADPQDQVEVAATTLSDVNGDFQLFLKPGAYNLLAVAPGFAPAAVNFSALAGANPTQDFALTSAPTGTLQGKVTIAGADADTFARLSLRQDLLLDGVSEAVEVEGLDIKNGAGYSVSLPVASYDAVASTCNFPTQVSPVDLVADTASVLDLGF